MKETNVVARIKRQDAAGVVALIQDADEEDTEIFVDSKYSFTIYRHLGTFSSEAEIEKFIRKNADSFGVSVVGDDGEVNMEFVSENL